MSIFIKEPEKVTKDSKDVGIKDFYKNDPISEDEYRSKVDFKSYFSLIGVSYRRSENFHTRIYNRDIRGALMSVRRDFADPAGRVNLRFIFKHLRNAIERADGRKVYVRKRHTTSKQKGMDHHSFYEKQKLIRSRAKSFIERIRE